MRFDMMSEALDAVVAQVLDSLELDLVELRVGGSRSRPTIDVRIDRRDGSPVAVDDCAGASRALEQRLDTEVSLGERYVLQVSSPGVERPLRSPADWRRFVGRTASVVSPLLHGRAEVEIVGVEGEPGGEVVIVRDGKGAEQRMPLAGVSDARLAFHW
ncbi:MAG: ribosome maturation factor RimP [Gemmatimonadaceae bacterium]